MPSYITGIDVSHHNGNVDWPKVAGAGHKFAFCKATEGRTFIDPRFDENWRAMEAAGLLRGAYHFAKPKFDPLVQAKHFHEVVGQIDAGELPPVLDLEEWTEQEPDDIIDWALACLREIERLFGRKPSLYTGPSYWRFKLKKTDRLAAYPLWEASYAAAAQPKPMTAWPSWTFWQFTGEGSCPGVSGKVDLNRFQGSEQELRNLAGVSAVAPPLRVEAPPPDFAARIPKLDLDLARGHKEVVERIQGLLLAQGYGPDGLVDPDTGLPDGFSGSKTRGYVRHFKRTQGLPADAVVDAATWWAHR